jgi:uracil-DNA glycosylase family 4
VSIILKPESGMAELLQCRQCSRLADYLSQVKQQFPDYYCKPVPAVGPEEARLLIVGLAPGKHGANATGIPFTGDASGALLFKMLHLFGFTRSDQSSSSLHKINLQQCRITNAVKCLPPSNKPTAHEISLCNSFLGKEINSLSKPSLVLALGRLAHNAVIKAVGLKQTDFNFAHAAEHQLTEQISLVDSYHCSRYNIQTKRLTEDMFSNVFRQIKCRLN